MTASWLEQVEAWHDFYVVTGGAAAGLTGLMFVVVSLGPQTISERNSAGVRGYVTPTVFFFGTVLVLSALMTAPGFSARLLGATIGAGGVCGLVYLITTRAHKTWRESKLGPLDWFWYVGLPIFNYLLIIAAAAEVWRQQKLGLEILGGVAILLLVNGIRNAWDLVIWMAQQQRS
jgi:hypothetical protein